MTDSPDYRALFGLKPSRVPADVQKKLASMSPSISNHFELAEGFTAHLLTSAQPFIIDANASPQDLLQHVENSIHELDQAMFGDDMDTSAKAFRGVMDASVALALRAMFIWDIAEKAVETIEKDKQEDQK